MINFAKVQHCIIITIPHLRNSGKNHYSQKRNQPVNVVIVFKSPWNTIIYPNIYIGREFANDLEDQGTILGRVIPKT